MLFNDTEKKYLEFINSKVFVTTEDFFDMTYKSKTKLDQSKFKYKGKNYNSYNINVREINENDEDAIITEIAHFYLFCEELYKERIISKIEIKEEPKRFFVKTVECKIVSDLPVNNFLVLHNSERYFSTHESKELERNDYKTKNEIELAGEREQRKAAEKRTMLISICAIIIPALLAIATFIFGSMQSNQTTKIMIMNENTKIEEMVNTGTQR
ncbi:hypothetical protein AGMMS49991_02580 [Spirochaetia bacterium]|nr:hypothetical protein AGMMS49991_02580 [Spirochaetia bacterium]